LRLGEGDLADLMRAANRGDAEAYRKLLRETSPVLRGFVQRTNSSYRLSPEDVEDIVQETLLAMHLKRHTWVQSKPLLPWVRAMAYNKLVDHLRRSGRGEQLPIDEFGDLLVADAPTSISSAVDAETAIGKLKGRQRDVVMAISVNGKSAREVAEELAMTEGAVRVVLHRALRSLSKALRSDRP
jgi:RNA polymerase sigma-70 factor (ECF subfamily)